jgi:DNA-directed RNA polymerase subunit beta'
MVKLASPEQIAKWSPHWSVDSPDTINYRTWKPKHKWLFCESIFGPVKNFECSCGKYKWIRYKGIVCERCGVEVTTSRVRRERMGHIDLASPVAHVRYVKASPSRIGLLLNYSVNEIEKIIYYVKYVVVNEPEETKVKECIKRLDERYNEKIKELELEYKNETEKLDNANIKWIEYKVKQDELKRIKADNGSILDKEYSRIKSIIANLKYGMTVLESDYRNVFWQFNEVFQFTSGSEALLKLLTKIDVQADIKKLIDKIPNMKKEEQKKSMKLFRLLVNLYVSEVKPEWMIIKKLPVIPPDLRPVVQLEWGKFASSDINLYYRRVLMRNNRLKRMIQVGMPDVVKKNEIRLLQESVNNLIVGEKNTAGKLGAWQKQFKSLTDMLSGKEGIFRKNLLGKRVDYSGRSVITVWPWLKLDECGLPLYIAVKIFTPFIISKLLERKIVHTPKKAEKMIKEESPLALKILEEIVKDKYVLLNRAPTLHRLSIQAFKIKLMPGKTIRLHPLACTAFNADFDGDQMAVHLPISEEAQEEAWSLIVSTKNILKPSSWEPIITHSQDMVLGIYYLTDQYDSNLTDKQGQNNSQYDDYLERHIDSSSKKYLPPKWIYNSFEKILHALHHGSLHIKDVVMFSIHGDVFATTVGRILFNSILPSKTQFIKNEKINTKDRIGKKELKKILDYIFSEYDMEETVRVADAIKDFGFTYASMSTTTVNVFEMLVPQEKQEIMKYGNDRVNGSNILWIDDLQEEEVIEYMKKWINGLYFEWFLSDSEKHALIVETWTEVKKRIEDATKKNYNSGNSVYTMIDSGARWSLSILTQLSGMKWLVVSPTGQIIELPIKSSLIEWFTPIEYFTAAFSGRKGKADTALRTAESWYLTRRLCDCSQEVIVREKDCNSTDGIYITQDEAKLRWESFESLIMWRTVAKAIQDDRNHTILDINDLITPEKLGELKSIFGNNLAQLDVIKVRSPLTCHTISGVCQKCFGMDLATREQIQLWAPIGIIASQSIWEPGTQLTMRTYHGGNVVGQADITQGGIKRVDSLFEIRTPDISAIIAPFDGNVSINNEWKDPIITIESEYIPHTYIIKDGYKVKVKKWDTIKKWWDYASMDKSKLKVKGSGKVLEIKKDHIVVGEILTIQETLYPGLILDKALEKEIKQNSKVWVFKGQILTNGALNIREYQEIKGDLEAQRYIVKEVKKVYTEQAQEVNDKYMEIIVKQLFSKILIQNAGESTFIPGTVVKYEEFFKANKKLKQEKKKPATGVRQALGITQVAKETDSRLSAASFQETMRVMVESSTKGAIDSLDDLKSNVILGRLLPVGKVFQEKHRKSLILEQEMQEEIIA